MTIKKGFATLAALAVSGMVGMAVAAMASQAAEMEATAEIFLADLLALNMFYQGRNIQEIITMDSSYVFEKYIEEGGPQFFGSILFEGKFLSILKDRGSSLTYSQNLVNNESGRLATQVAKQYEDLWGITTSNENTSFCLKRKTSLKFGEHVSKFCFESPLQMESFKVLIPLMITTIENENTCIEFGSYSICWADLIFDGITTNFTYAIHEIVE